MILMGECRICKKIFKIQIGEDLVCDGCIDEEILKKISMEEEGSDGSKRCYLS